MANRFLVQALVFCCLLTQASFSSGQTCCFDEAPRDSMTVMGVNPQDTVNAVAIYACWDSVSHTLPDWWASIWSASPDTYSVTNYFKDVSFDRHVLFGTPVARTADSAFTSQYNPAGNWGGGSNFTWDILTKADSVIDFAQYDTDPQDGTVDMVVLMILRASGKSISQLWIGAHFQTNDTTATGAPVFINWSLGMAIYALGIHHGVGVTAHEYGHQLGLWDYYDWALPDTGSGLGYFGLMTCALGFERKQPSPINPWWRSEYHLPGKVPFFWLWPTHVDSTSQDQPIQDITTGEVYKLVSDLGSAATSMSGQKYLVTNHQAKSYWEENWPDRGLMLWHVFDNTKAAHKGGDSRKKNIDVEAAHGLWSWDFGTRSVIGPDPVGGVDSLDVKYSDTSNPYGYMGSATCLYRVGIDSIFDAFSNPSSDEYNLGDSVPVQDIASHIAVRNIHADATDSTVIRADLIVNRVESDAATATGENNARRWVLGPDRHTMHLVYVSKGCIYYTTTDSNKVWLPAIPIGEGSYPSLSLDASGDPAVVWIQQGDCNTANAKLFFSKRDAGNWRSPDTLLSFYGRLGLPSFAIDTSDVGHVAYTVGNCIHDWNSALYYGTFDTDSPTFQDTLLEPSSSVYGNAAICYAEHINSVHVGWDRARKIWYNWKDATGWHTPQDVSGDVNDSSRTPSFWANGSVLHVVWAFDSAAISDSIPPKDVLFHRSRTICDTCSWGNKTAATDTFPLEVYQPVVVDGPGGLYALWSGTPSVAPQSQSDISYSKWVGGSPPWEVQGTMSNTSVASNYPQALQRAHPSGGVNAVKLEVIWTDGDCAPFHIANKGPIVGTDLGGGGQSGARRNGAPKVFALEHPFPNPFARGTTIRYEIPYPCGTSIKVYDIAGRLVKTLVYGPKKSGVHTAEWAGDDDAGRLLTNGVYFIRLRSGGFSVTRKSILLR